MTGFDGGPGLLSGNKKDNHKNYMFDNTANIQVVTLIGMANKMDGSLNSVTLKNYMLDKKGKKYCKFR